MRFPKLTGSISIREEEGKIVIAGDSDGLRSLGRLLTWLGDADQESWPYLPAGGRAHLHIYPRHDISANSREVELMRLDVKGEGKPPALKP
jgi:glyoxylase-like metal-dependent hydrolase (beta-lactamase superfamily II)